jgi:hypothetical protein
VHLPIPKKCPTKVGQSKDNIEDQGPPKKKKTTLVNTEVRRISRLREKSRGFMHPRHLHSVCPSCNIPSINPKIIKKLGVEFCKVDKDLCFEDALSASKPKLGAIQHPCKPSSSSKTKLVKKKDDKKDGSEKKGPRSPDME